MSVGSHFSLHCEALLTLLNPFEVTEIYLNFPSFLDNDTVQLDYIRPHSFCIIIPWFFLRFADIRSRGCDLVISRYPRYNTVMVEIFG